MLSKHHWVGACEYKVKYSREMKTQHKDNGMENSWNVEDTGEYDYEDWAKESRERDYIQDTLGVRRRVSLEAVIVRYEVSEKL